MIRRAALVSLLLACTVALPTLAASPLAGIQHDLPPYLHGDGDGPLAMAVSPTGQMWAVWSYRYGGEFSVAVTRSLQRTWDTPTFIGALNGKDELDPKLAFLFDGTPVLTWWVPSQDTTPSGVYLSYLVSDGWTVPLLASSPGMNAERPAFLQNETATTLAFIEFDPNPSVPGIVRAIPVTPPSKTGGTNGPDPIPTIIIDGDGNIVGGELPEVGTNPGGVQSN